MTKKTETKYIMQVKRYINDKWHNLASYQCVEKAMQDKKDKLSGICCWQDIRIVKAKITTLIEIKTINN